ncbi:PREDICTED: uncharacterized protein LOC109584739 [Amphimedon queenslandica]|uniref:Uncharacterized protein n=1 Tax=Amphimedon queenslandica TaxID=400682 RepID=A0AAN0JGN9_AMPQE|nr:PREDICTED: uncharacterized protein LOC109584739 [Amphimedon queenslandica]XP_019856131.1 PREDICTED: uncharacterized protein LOC109584739 [Amphimedon queenslandica]|eukprot:XP_019856129.1 PREDICTED: uncharacterized protein LOC109584739 [Amphimedon queenslandica]
MMAGGSAEVQKPQFKQANSHPAVSISGSQTHPPKAWCYVSRTKEETEVLASPVKKKSLKDYMWSLVNGSLTLLSIFVYCAVLMTIYIHPNNLLWLCVAVFLNVYALVVSIMTAVKTKDENWFCLFVLILNIIIITKAESNTFNYIFFIFAALIIFIKKEPSCTIPQTITPSTDNDKDNTIFIV